MHHPPPAKMGRCMAWDTSSRKGQVLPRPSKASPKLALGLTLMLAFYRKVCRRRLLLAVEGVNKTGVTPPPVPLGESLFGSPPPPPHTHNLRPARLEANELRYLS